MQASSVTRSDTGLARNGHKQLTEITATLHAVVENLDGFIWTIDKNRQYLVLNSHFRKKVKELSGAEIKPGSHVVDFTSLLNATPQLDWEKLYQTGFNGIPQQFVCEFLIENKPAFFEISVTPIQEDGKITALTCFVNDVTERKKTEQALQQSELKFRSLIENSTDIITMANADGNFFYGSPSAKKILGYDEQDYMGRHVCSFIHPDSLTATVELLQKMVKYPDQLFTIDLKVFHKDGSVRWVQGLASNMLQVPGVNALVGNFRDITERKNSEDEKIRLERQLSEEKVQRQREITKAAIDAQEKERETLGRELHDNITQILSTARLCLSCAKDNPAQQADMLQRSQDNITTAIEEIRRLSRSMIETFHREVGLKLSVHDLIENISLARNCDITLDYSVPDEQQLDDKLKTTIFRIVQEQLNNIIKHAEATVIKIAIVQDDNQLQVTIEDNGKGFDTTAKRKGIGITNMITRAELFNGRAKIEAAPGKGCRMQANFNIRL
jgi:PAS domain S-box-containing protein